MSLVGGGIVLRVRRRPDDRSRLLIEVVRARDEILAGARRSRGRDDPCRAAALFDAAALISAAITRAADT